MTQASAIVVTWSPEAPPNRKRWEAEIRNVLGSPIGAPDVKMTQEGDCWKVATALVADATLGTVEMRHAVTDYLRALGFPVCP